MAEAALAQGKLAALRSEIGRLENAQTMALSLAAREDAWDWSSRKDDGLIPSGAEGLDSALGGGFARSALHEIRTAATADNGAASGFALALARLALGQTEPSGARASRILWIADPVGAFESGRPYGPGLATHGVPPAALVHASPRHLKDALMIAEAALAVQSFAAVILEIYGNPRKLGLTESRRLNLRARAYRRPVLMLREHGEEEASNALTRFRVGPSPAAPYRPPGGQAAYPSAFGNPVFHVTLEKSRNPSPPAFLLEWNSHDGLFRELEAGPYVVSGGRPKDSRPVLSPAFDRPDRPDSLGPVVAFPRAS